MRKKWRERPNATRSALPGFLPAVDQPEFAGQLHFSDQTPAYTPGRNPKCSAHGHPEAPHENGQNSGARQVPPRHAVAEK